MEESQKTLTYRSEMLELKVDALLKHLVVHFEYQKPQPGELTIRPGLRAPEKGG